MSGMNIYVAPGQMIWPRNAMMLGAAMLFVPLSTAAYTYLPKEQTNNASGLFNLFRNEGGSIGVSLDHDPAPAADAVPPRAAGRARRPLQPDHDALDRRGGAVDAAGRVRRGPGRPPGLRMLEGTVVQQAAAMAYFDLFWLYAILALTMIPLVLLMRRSVAEGGTMAVH